jgi:hypothetical protein
MAHYAWIDTNNIVINVTTGVDETTIQDGIGGSTEAWETFYTNAVNQEGVYLKRTSYNNKIRGTYAGIGYSYNEEEDIFVAPQPYPSWIRSGSFWEAPVAMPTDDKIYTWNEDNISWDEVINEHP